MNSREKGKAGEREFAGLCRDHGYDVRRTAQYAGKTEDAADVVGLPGIHVEVKRVERLVLDDAMDQAIRDHKVDRLAIVAHRRNRGRWMVTMRAEDWFEIYREWEAGRSMTKKGTRE
jgi:Holliday junction resolvase